MRALHLVTWTAAALALAATGTRAEAAQLPASGAATAQTLKPPSGPGSVRGLATDPTVSTFSGQTSYHVPVELPAAPGSFKPELSLGYEGGLGNGPVGVGWKLDFPELRRSTRQGVPRFTSDDELELTGVARAGRVVALPDGTYRVSGQGNFVKLVPSGGGFVLSDGEGKRYALGTSAESRLESGTHVAAWLPASVTDAAGQRIAFTYLHDDGEVYLTSVVWGPGDVFRSGCAGSTTTTRVS